MFFGWGVVLVPATLVELVEVHCFSRMLMPLRAVRLPPLPCTRSAVMASGRLAPGLAKNWSNSVLDEPDVAKFSNCCFDAALFVATAFAAGG